MSNIYPNLEAIFNGNKENSKDILNNKIIVKQIEVNKLIEFKEHIFNSISNVKFEELKTSIIDNGILVPIIIRPLSNNNFEIMSGHNRVRACKELNIDTIPAIIKDVDDDTAKLIMIDTNVSQRDKLLPSELMKAYSIKQEILRQKHFDQFEKKEGNPDDKYDTREKLAEEENISTSQISRYIRLKELVEGLLEYVDIGRLPFNVGVNLSFLSKDKQEILLNILKDNEKMKVTLKQSEKLKTTKADLTESYILDILTNKNKKSIPKFTGKIKSPLVKKYKDRFNSDEEFTNLIEILLEKYFNSAEDLSDKNQT